MDIIESCNAIRKKLSKSGLHYFIKESPFSLWITIKKKKIDVHQSETELDSPVTQDAKVLENEIRFLKERLQKSEAEINNLKTKNSTLQATNENYLNWNAETNQLKSRKDSARQDTLTHGMVGSTGSLGGSTACYPMVASIPSARSRTSHSTKLQDNHLSESQLTTTKTNHTIPTTTLISISNPNSHEFPNPSMVSDSHVFPAPTLVSNRASDFRNMFSFSAVSSLTSLSARTKPYPSLLTSTSSPTPPSTSCPNLTTTSPTFLSSALVLKTLASRTFKCEICGERFLQASNMDFHIKRDHKKPFT
eukprot:TRINITY_DN55126_c0_g1_i1.p1 TRINITY_DN55126_c0_g1~~TRINITY_DN55126_c0_g1_i1.p1  ORF type:complete len:323 (+),score=71.97 TRINITY_DN55126_c0_g1_i1:52-969(+)